jgi:HipA-like C-terminal domain
MDRRCRLAGVPGVIEQPFEVFTVSDDAPLNPEQLGTKDKFWFSRDGRRWLFKTSRAGSGEHWAEVIASVLARGLGLPCAEYQLAVWRGERGVVTPRFLDDGYDLVHGNELLAERDPTYQREGARFVRPKQHTIDAVAAVVGAHDVQTPFGWENPVGMSAIDVFAGYLLLDAWTGNTDRHHVNWALVYRIADGRRALSPTFDHASSLGSHESDATRVARLKSADPGYRIDAYVARSKVRSPFFASASDGAGLSPIDAFRQWSERANAGAWVERLRRVTTEDVRKAVLDAPDSMMSGPSRDFAGAILTVNRERILGRT